MDPFKGPPPKKNQSQTAPPPLVRKALEEVWATAVPSAGLLLSKLVDSNALVGESAELLAPPSVFSVFLGGVISKGPGFFFKGLAKVSL